MENPRGGLSDELANDLGGCTAEGLHQCLQLLLCGLVEV